MAEKSTGEHLDALLAASSPVNVTQFQRSGEATTTSRTEGAKARAVDLKAVKDSVIQKQKALWAKSRELMEAGKQDTPEYDELVKQNKFLSRKILFMDDAIKHAKEGTSLLGTDDAQTDVNIATYEKNSKE